MLDDWFNYQDEMENATDEPTSGLEWSRGIFVSPTIEAAADGGQDTSRIDTGTTSTIADKFNWLKNRHKWDWWQKARQPRQPWPSPSNSSGRRRKRRRRRLS